MEITRTGLVALVAMCGVAGAGGAFVATRGAAIPAASVEAAPEPGLPATVEPAPTVATRFNEPAPIARPRAAVSRNETRVERQTAAPLARPAVTVVERPHVTDVAVTPAPADASTTSQIAPQIVEIPNIETPPFEELVVERDVVLGLQVDTTISSETARIEDQVIAHVTRDVRVDDRIAIPSGAKVYGDVTQVERGGKFRERARLAVRFSSIELADGSRVPISTDLIMREGDSPTRESTAKIGGSAIGGAILGGILGGGKGAIIGSTAGAGAGTAVVMAGGRNEAVLAAGTPVTVRLTRPATVTVDR